jgi:hypothetical protein
MPVVELDLSGIADVGIVPVELMKDAVIGPLDEGAEMVGDLAAGKQAHLLHRRGVIVGEAGGQAARLRRLQMREPRLQCHRKRRTLPVAAAQVLGAELEAAAERRQFKKGGMAGGAEFPGLPRIKRQGRGRPRRFQTFDLERRRSLARRRWRPSRGATSAAEKPISKGLDWTSVPIPKFA